MILTTNCRTGNQTNRAQLASTPIFRSGSLKVNVKGGKLAPEKKNGKIFEQEVFLNLTPTV